MRQSQKSVWEFLQDDNAFAQFEGVAMRGTHVYVRDHDDGHTARTFLGYVVCEPPNTELHTFTGKLVVGLEAYALDNDAVLLRVCIQYIERRWCGAGVEGSSCNQGSKRILRYMYI